jgi:regulator of RNase E activity RraA
MSTLAAPLALIDRLHAIPYTGAVADVLDEMGFPCQVLPHSIRPLVDGWKLAGRALTILGRPSEKSDPDEVFPPLLTMLGDVKPGDVLISRPNDDVAAHLGELSAETAKYRGARGAVIDGGARDTDYILRLGFPVFCRYTTPKDVLGRWELEAYNVPITIGDVRIEPGDFVLGDRDGVVIVPAAIAEEVVGKAEEIVSTENLVRKAILEGVHPLEAYRRYGRF